MTVSYLEIYNEKLKDLLDPRDKTLKVFASSKTGVVVKNLANILCDSYDEVLNLLKEGKKMRVVAATKMNS